MGRVLKIGGETLYRTCLCGGCSGGEGVRLEGVLRGVNGEEMCYG